MVWQGKGITDDDFFTFNEEFNSKLKRIKVPLVSMKEAVNSEEATPEALPAPVEEERRHL